MKGCAVGIGGTGARSLEALVYLTAMGISEENIENKNDELIFVIIDQDNTCGNVGQLKKTIEDYISFQSKFEAVNDIFINKLRLYQNNGNDIWMPAEKNTDGANTFGNYLGYEKLKYENSSDKMIFELLFTQKEINIVLDKGVVGRAKAGSAIFDLECDKACDKDGYFGQLINTINSWPDDQKKIFVYGSIFGGMGASGFPIFIKKIKEKIVGNGKKGGGCLLLPYFKFNDEKLADKQADKKKKNNEEQQVISRSSHFLMKSKIALKYYYKDLFQRSDWPFDSLYILGEDNHKFIEIDEVNTSVSGASQKNPSHYLELMAALSSIHFFTDNSNSVKNQFKLSVGPDIEEKNSIHFQDLPIIGNKRAELYRKKFLYFTAFAATFKFIFKLLSNYSRQLDRLRWYAKHFKGTEISKGSDYELLKNINTFLTNYIEWLKYFHNNKLLHINLLRKESLNKEENNDDFFPSLLCDILYFDKNNPDTNNMSAIAQNMGIGFNRFLEIINSYNNKPEGNTDVSRFINLIYKASKEFCDCYYFQGKS